MNNNYITVGALTRYIKYKIDNDVNLQTVYIKGEISNFKHHSRGHFYFTIKDEESRINAIMFASSTKNINFEPVDGMKVLVKGRISVFEQTGNYQIYVTDMTEDGVGNLYALYEKLKKQLAAEGLFDQKYKKEIPKIPKRIGVVTAPTGAAIKDIISTINRRYPLCEVILFPSLVQGKEAKDDIVKNIKIADTYNLDTLIVGRGGGSLEDLWAFNEEIVARAIFECKTPVISAVGHEGDYTICDFVASYRAPTPTGAAMKLTKDKNDVLNILVNYSKRLSADIKSKLTLAYNNWKKLSTSYMLVNFNNVLDEKLQKCLNLDARLSQFAPDRFVKRLEDNLEQLEKRLKKAGEYSFEINNNLYNGIACRVKEELILKNIEKCEKEISGIDEELSEIDSMLTKEEIYTDINKLTELSNRKSELEKGKRKHLCKT